MIYDRFKETVSAESNLWFHFYSVSLRYFTHDTIDDIVETTSLSVKYILIRWLSHPGKRKNRENYKTIAFSVMRKTSCSSSCSSIHPSISLSRMIQTVLGRRKNVTTSVDPKRKGEGLILCLPCDVRGRERVGRRLVAAYNGISKTDRPHLPPLFTPLLLPLAREY